MEVVEVNEDLPTYIKEEVVKELKKRKLVLDLNKPIKKDAFGHFYRTRSTDKKDLSVCKVIVIPKDLSLKAKNDLMRSVQEEVTISYKV